MFNIDKNDYVIILSAMTSPSEVFKNKNRSNKVNVINTKKIITDLKKIDCKIIFLSSVEVFDGRRVFIRKNQSQTQLICMANKK